MMETEEIGRAIEAILFAAGDPVGAQRMAQAIGVGLDQVEAALKTLMDAYSFQRRGMRIIQLEDAYQMVSAQDMSDVITRALETQKAPQAQRLGIGDPDGDRLLSAHHQSLCGADSRRGQQLYHFGPAE